MKNFCHNAFTGIDITPGGTIKPCCKFLQATMPTFHISEGIEKFRDSEFRKGLQQEFLDGKRPKGCDRCWKEEDAGVKSKRQLDYERHRISFDNLDLQRKDFTNISLNFGNICNLACRICGPNRSSRWVAENIKHGDKAYPIYDWFKQKDVMEDIFFYTKEAVHFDIPGGEPLLMDIEEHFEFLDRFSQDRKQQISLHYTTNGTNWPKQSHLESWKHFKEIDIQISIDDTGKRFEYNRWPAKWPQVYENIKKFQSLSRSQSNIRLSVSFTVSAFTIFYADEFFTWCIREGLPPPWMGRLHEPVFYRCGIYDEDTATKIKTKLQQSKIQQVRSLADYVDPADRVHFEDFKKQINRLDIQRNQNFNNTFPEIAISH